jgi:hypothetical protein
MTRFARNVLLWFVFLMSVAGTAVLLNHYATTFDNGVQTVVTKPEAK